METAVEGHNEDFSSNALTDGLEKYSRFHSKNEFSVWCSSPNAKLNKGIRELVYQINPNNILCVYKKLFETCALNNLRVVDHGEDESTSPENTSLGRLSSGAAAPRTPNGNVSEPSTPRSSEPPHINKSNSCIYESHSEVVNGTKRARPKHFSGWTVCERPHSAGYQKTNLEESRDLNKRQGRTNCCGSASPRPMSTSNRTLNLVNKYGYDLIRSRRRSRDLLEDSSSVSSVPASPYKPIKPTKHKHFKHFKRSTSYMEQYREEYTYRKLKDYNRIISVESPASVDSQTCMCGSPGCSGSMSAASIPRWYPFQSHRVQNMNIPRDMVALNAIKPPVQPICSPVIKRLAAKKLAQIASPPSEKETKKLEFFSTSLTVNSYNPTVKQSQSAARLSTSQCRGCGHRQPTPTGSKNRSFPSSPDVTNPERLAFSPNF